MEDDESDEIDRIARELGLQLPDLEDNGEDDEAPPSLDDLDENDVERTPRDWRREHEREWGDDE